MFEGPEVLGPLNEQLPLREPRDCCLMLSLALVSAEEPLKSLAYDTHTDAEVVRKQLRIHPMNAAVRGGQIGKCLYAETCLDFCLPSPLRCDLSSGRLQHGPSNDADPCRPPGTLIQLASQSPILDYRPQCKEGRSEESSPAGTIPSDRP